jgi:hypothetical protein
MGSERGLGISKLRLEIDDGTCRSERPKVVQEMQLQMVL